MKFAHVLSLFLACAAGSGCFTKSVPKSPSAAGTSVHTLTVEDIGGNQIELAQYRGSVLLIVNVASQCGFTPQYEALEKLELELAPQKFHVLGFPCNQFGEQEPGSSAQIAKFCKESYQVSFPLFAKVKVKAGEGQAPLYTLLGAATGSLPGWNFGKYVVGRDGRARAFFASTVKPDDADLRAAIEKALAEKT